MIATGIIDTTDITTGTTDVTATFGETTATGAVTIAVIRPATEPFNTASSFANIGHDLATALKNAVALPTPSMLPGVAAPA